MKSNFVFKAAAVIAAIAIMIIAYNFLCMHCLNFEVFKPHNIKNYILSFGAWAIFVYVLLYTINTITLLPPIGIMSLSAGAILGPLYGTLGVMIGSFLGTSATFFISRKLGSNFVQRIIKGKAKEFQEKLDHHGFKVILLIRLIPVLPWEVVNYASGLSKIKYRDYILGTLIGIFPSVLVQVYFSHSAVNFNAKDPNVWLAVVAFLLLMIIPAIYIKRRKDAKV